MMVMFKMRDSVPSASYSSVCKCIPSMEHLAHPVYQLYDILLAASRLAPASFAAHAHRKHLKA